MNKTLTEITEQAGLSLCWTAELPDEDYRLVYEWNGSHTVNVFIAFGDEDPWQRNVDVFTLPGTFDPEAPGGVKKPTPEDVAWACLIHVEEHRQELLIGDDDC